MNKEVIYTGFSNMVKKPIALLSLLDSPEGEFMYEFIMENPKSRLPMIYNAYPNHGVYELMKSDPDISFLKELDKNPKLITTIKEVSPEMERLVNEESKRIHKELDKTIDSITNAFKSMIPIIHEDEYLINFHDLFNGRYNDIDGLNKYEINERYRKIHSWITYTKSINSKIHIVNSDGEVLFKHPGLMVMMNLETPPASWQSFERNSKLNEERLPRLKDEYQKDFTDKFMSHTEKTALATNKENIIEFRRIMKYFNNRYSLEILKEAPKENEETKPEVVIAKNIDYNLYD